MSSDTTSRRGDDPFDAHTAAALAAAPMKKTRRRVTAGQTDAVALAGREQQRVRQGSDAFRFDALLAGAPDGAHGGAQTDGLAPAPGTSAAGELKRPVVAEGRPDLPVAAPMHASAAPRANSDRRPVLTRAELSVAAVLATAAACLVVFAGPLLRGTAGADRGGVRDAAPPLAGPGMPIAATAGASPTGRPDPARTPGRATSLVVQPGMMTAGSKATPVPEAVRGEVFRAYRIAPEDQQRFVACRLIPTALNGDDSPQNVFPTTPWFAGLKARLDRRLTERVAAGEMTMEQAHRELTSDWIAAAHRHYVRNYGEQDEAAARKKEQSLGWR